MLTSTNHSTEETKNVPQSDIYVLFSDFIIFESDYLPDDLKGGRDQIFCAVQTRPGPQNRPTCFNPWP